METAETRREAGDLIKNAAKRRRLSQRELARRAGISETWLRAMTAGLSGEDPQKASDDTWVALASVVGLDARNLFSTLGRDLPDWVEEAGVLVEREHQGDAERRTYEADGGAVGLVQHIARDIEADIRSDDLTNEEAEELLERALEQARTQALMLVHMERVRRQREKDE